MEEKMEKIASYAGGVGPYQIIILVLSFIIWSAVSIHNTSIPMLEKVPLVTYTIKAENKTQTVPLTYEICKAKNYTVDTVYGYSWISELGIECDERKVGFIGAFTYSGLCIGSFLFSVMNKFLSPRYIVIIAISVYVPALFSTTLIDSFYYRLGVLLVLGMGNGLTTFTTMTMVNESVGSKWRSFFSGIINIGYSASAIMYTPLYSNMGKWRYVFWTQNVIAGSCCILFLIVLLNTPRYYFSRGEPENAVKSLKQIAAFNGRAKEFTSHVNDEEFNSLLNKENKNMDKEIPQEIKPKFGYSALVKYPSIRYKFLIFTWMFMSVSFLTNAVVIGTKNMKGDTNVIIVVLYGVEVVANISCGFILNWPPLGRKKSLILFYTGIVIGFVIYITFNKLDFNAFFQLLPMMFIRFCITGVYASFYVYFLESYPTPIRSLGFGLNSTFGNLAGIVSPIIIESFPVVLLYIVFAILCAVNVFLTFFLEETVGRPMIETIKELTPENVEQDVLVPTGRESVKNDIEKGTTKPENKASEPLIAEKDKDNAINADEGNQINDEES